MNLVQISILWLIGASVIGFGMSAIFSGWLKLSRRIFLIPYIAASGLVLFLFLNNNPIVSNEFWFHNWDWGLAASIIAGAFLIKNVLSQPYSRTEKGMSLYLDLVWFGLAYGIIDGLFLNVLPVVAVLNIFSDSNLSGNIPGQILIGFLALMASLIVTLFYHLGYPEFRNKSVILVLLGNTIITLTFIISGNPLSAVLTHTVMHMAAVFRGPETTIQLPPHYQ
ncbi:MAG TPA: hypothetical protein PK816_05445 [Candidatus Cloacimonadota bacterium]|nr:hypothetical protein [Candidatus Cloacimonadota bacterium]